MLIVRQLVYGVALAIALAFTGCTGQRGELGSEKNPIKFYFTPSQDAKSLEDNSRVLKDYLEAHTPYKFHMTVPQSYIAVVESFGTKRADIAAINTFGYLTANEKYGAEAKLITVRHGKSTYQSQFLAKSNSGIKKIEDLQGKKVAFVDPSSTSGYLLPMKTLKEKNIEPKDTVYAMKHDTVVSMIYQGQVDAGATFYSPPHEGKMEDARRLVLAQYPDVEDKIKIIQLSEEIPNDPIIFRKDLTAEMKKKIIDALLMYVSTEDGKTTFKKLLGATDLQQTQDEVYIPVKNMLKTVGKKPEDLMVK